MAGVPRCRAAEVRGGPVGSGFPNEIGKAGVGEPRQVTGLDSSPGGERALPGLQRWL